MDHLLDDRPPISLSAVEFDVLWDHLKPGTMPLVVKVPSPGRTHEERKAIEQGAWAALDQRGLGRGVDVHPEVEHLFALLARPDREVDGRTWVGRGVRLLACAAGDDAALAVLSEGSITLRRTSAANLPAAAVGVLPPHPPGPGQSVTLRTEDFEAAAKASEGTRKAFQAALGGRGLRQDDVEALATMVDDVKGTGNFGAAARDRLGRRVRAERVVSFFDTEAGRYVQVRRAAPDGTLWTTISPADARRLTHHVEEMAAEVRRAVED
ncbi:ESX secretion-associated protein EspG [Actinokineospora bangkokensis]|uniref:ESX secretion-associated protein EspG n=1 Tax=Actinokineospora bangkokensis TaxID=1193682 RepID=A0A1Q9LFQ6_9PSEU|nr:ESX secretion-associated protein EspG [Actinokineospora bangkokensis]OLR90872.1 ESX secretion-associated protein EspG [Actinokineospora bangkokensis]